MNNQTPITADFGQFWNASAHVAQCIHEQLQTAPLSGCLKAVQPAAFWVCHAFFNRVDFAPSLSLCHGSKSKKSFKIKACLLEILEAIGKLTTCQTEQSLLSEALQNCQTTAFQAAYDLMICQNTIVRFSDGITACVGGFIPAKRLLKSCTHTRHKGAIKPPCVWQEIPVIELPEPPEPPTPILSPDIPIKDTYMIEHSISAYFDNHTPLQPLSASFSCDVDGFCWNASVSLYPDDFHALNFNRRTGEEAEITVILDGIEYCFIAEEYSDNRQFGKKTYTVSGRSKTARLAAGYAQTGDNWLDHDITAQQLINDRLELLNPYQLDRFAIEDWLIPANTYTTGNKTPMDVILDVAQAAGGFVFSHRKNPTISIGYKWKAPAWQIDTATPDLIIPDDVIVSISGRYRITEQANGVFVYGTGNNAKGADVFRSSTEREPRASALSHPLYTDEVVLRTAGIFALSETGRHKEETITLPVSAKDGIPCLDLGWLVQVNENNQLWRGVVESISINANVSNDGAISIMQTAGIDRYIIGF